MGVETRFRQSSTWRFFDGEPTANATKKYDLLFTQVYLQIATISNGITAYAREGTSVDVRIEGNRVAGVIYGMTYIYSPESLPQETEPLLCRCTRLCPGADAGMDFLMGDIAFCGMDGVEFVK